ncbi:MAG: tyrosine phosphatase family protein [Pararhizobium sp.]
MSYIVVSPLSRIVEAAVAHGAREMVSLLGENHAFHRPGIIDPRRHLFLDMNDIAVETQGLVVPQEHHVGRLIAFVRAWDRRAPLVVHCWMGISRSPAAALIAALALDPQQDDEKLARRLRDASPFSTPNARLIEIADRVLERDGRLVRGVRAIGRGADAYEGRPFCVTISPHDPAPRVQFDVPADG